MDVRSVASVFISRWDRGVADKVPANLQNRLGLAIGKAGYKTYRDLLDSDRWQRLANHGARPQRLLFASTSTKDPKAPDTLYVAGLAAPNTVNTMPEPTLKADGGSWRRSGALPRDGGDGEKTLADFERAGIDIAALGQQLQDEGADSLSNPGRNCSGGRCQEQSCADPLSTPAEMGWTPSRCDRRFRPRGGRSAHQAKIKHLSSAETVR